MSEPIVERVEALERQVRRWRVATTALLVAMATLVTVAATRGPQDVVQCKRLEVVGFGNKPRVRIATSGSGTGVIEIRDAGGREVLRLPPEKIVELPTAKGRQPAIVQSTIRGTFRGFESGRIHELSDGTLWEQISPELSIAVKNNPKVTLFKSSKGWTMHVHGELRPVLVRPVR